MKKQYFSILLALISLLGLSVAARAQEDGNVVAKIPYEFVAGGKTLRAGTYTIIRVAPEAMHVLAIRNNETSQDSAFLVPTSSAAAVDRVHVSLVRVGDTYYLSQVATFAGVYTLAEPTVATTSARIKQPLPTSFAGAK